VSKTAKFVVVIVVLAGATSLGYSFSTWRSGNLPQFAIFLALSVIASRIKLSLPGLDGNMSMNLPFTIISTLAFSPSQAIVITCVSTLTQCLPKSLDKMKLVQLVFSVSNMMNAVSLVFLAIRWCAARYAIVFLHEPLRSAFAAAVFLFAETLPVSGMIALTTNMNFKAASASLLRLTFPFFILSTGIADIATAVPQIGWQILVTVLVLMYGVYRSYGGYFHQSLA
jgi:hypothetical protein